MILKGQEELWQGIFLIVLLSATPLACSKSERSGSTPPLTRAVNALLPLAACSRCGGLHCRSPLENSILKSKVDSVTCHYEIQKVQNTPAQISSSKATALHSRRGIAFAGQVRSIKKAVIGSEQAPKLPSKYRLLEKILILQSLLFLVSSFSIQCHSPRPKCPGPPDGFRIRLWHAGVTQEQFAATRNTRSVDCTAC